MDLRLRAKLPDGFTARPPRREEAPELAEILAACERANSGASTMTIDEFLGDWEGANPETDALVILDRDERPVAYADIDLRGNVVVNVSISSRCGDAGGTGGWHWRCCGGPLASSTRAASLTSV